MRLLDALSGDPRATAAELGRRVGMSAPAVRERLTRLEQTGVIRGYRLDIDPAAIGLPVAAWVRIRPGPGQLPKIAELAARTPQGQRVSPHLRRGLLSAQGPHTRHRRPRRSPRPVPALRPNPQVLRRGHPRTTTHSRSRTVMNANTEHHHDTISRSSLARPSRAIALIYWGASAIRGLWPSPSRMSWLRQLLQPRRLDPQRRALRLATASELLGRQLLLCPWP
jgi:hypothetical protein